VWRARQGCRASLAYTGYHLRTTQKKCCAGASVRRMLVSLSVDLCNGILTPRHDHYGRRVTLLDNMIEEMAAGAILYFHDP
jgi:hypothetical protein